MSDSKTNADLQLMFFQSFALSKDELVASLHNALTNLAHQYELVVNLESDLAHQRELVAWFAEEFSLMELVGGTPKEVIERVEEIIRKEQARAGEGKHENAG